MTKNGDRDKRRRTRGKGVKQAKIFSRQGNLLSGRFLILTVLFFLIFFCHPDLRAVDRGSIIAVPVSLAQDSQKAVIFHNKQEEILVLATELRAEKETTVLEFIPFPSEPVVFLVKEPILEKIGKLLKEKDIRAVSHTKGEGVGGAPVEIKLSQKIGLHDVTVVKINQPAEFESWVRQFFSQKNIKLENKLDHFIANARDYLERGFIYFVFDSVVVGNQVRTVEPLGYRFKSRELYYPLKTSNLIGGCGQVDLALILPGSFYVEEEFEIKEKDQKKWEKYFHLFYSGWTVTSSSKMYPEEIEELLPEASGFFRPGQKIYLQLLRYWGDYNFKDDLIWDISALPRYAHKIKYGMFGEKSQKMTEDEMMDYFQAKCAEDPDFLKKGRALLDDMMLGYLMTSGLTCQDIVHPEEFQVYKAVFNPPQLTSVRLDGLPTGLVVLEEKTVNRKFENIKGLDKALLDDYNARNNKEYNLSEFLPEGMEEYIRIKESGSVTPLFPGRNYVSRVGFNPTRTSALVFVSHVAGPEMGVGYLVMLEKHQGTWLPVKILSQEVY